MNIHLLPISGNPINRHVLEPYITVIGFQIHVFVHQHEERVYTLLDIFISVHSINTYSFSKNHSYPKNIIVRHTSIIITAESRLDWTPRNHFFDFKSTCQMRILFRRVSDWPVDWPTLWLLQNSYMWQREVHPQNAFVNVESVFVVLFWVLDQASIHM